MKHSPFAPYSPAIPATWTFLLMISGVLCQGVSKASVSFGISFGLESQVSMSVDTQAKLIILVKCLAEQAGQV